MRSAAKSSAVVSSSPRPAGWSDGRYSSIARLRSVGGLGVPEVRAMAEATYFSGLRKAGVPND